MAPLCGCGFTTPATLITGGSVGRCAAAMVPQPLPTGATSPARVAVVVVVLERGRGALLRGAVPVSSTGVEPGSKARLEALAPYGGGAAVRVGGVLRGPSVGRLVAAVGRDVVGFGGGVSAARLVSGVPVHLLGVVATAVDAAVVGTLGELAATGVVAAGATDVGTLGVGLVLGGGSAAGWVAGAGRAFVAVVATHASQKTGQTAAVLGMSHRSLLISLQKGTSSATPLHVPPATDTRGVVASGAAVLCVGRGVGGGGVGRGGARGGGVGGVGGEGAEGAGVVVVSGPASEVLVRAAVAGLAWR